MIGRRDLLTALLSLLFATPARRAAAWQAPTPKGRAKRQNKARGGGEGGLPAFDAIMEGVLTEHQIVGASLAIAHRGRLVLARGYGLADAEAGRPVTAETLFCIASISKSITAVAALRLVDEGRLRLDTRIVDVLGDLRPPGGMFADPRFAQITLRHLLFHGSGIPNRVAVDRSRMAVGARTDAGDDDEGEGGAEVAAATVRSAMAGPLDFAPGSDHKYSNSGYMVARQVVERAAGQDYVKYVHEHVLGPMGINRAMMEAARPVAGETARYVLRPGGRRPAARNPVNWMFTPAELVKFVATVAGERGKPFLSPAMYRAMVALPPPPIKPGPNGRHVGLGWDSVQNTPQGDGFSKNGAKAGVFAWAQHRPDGVSWAFMLNTTRPGAGPDGPQPENQITRRVNQTLDAQTSWPAVDLFDRGPGG